MAKGRVTEKSLRYLYFVEFAITRYVINKTTYINKRDMVFEYILSLLCFDRVFYSKSKAKTKMNKLNEGLK